MGWCPACADADSGSSYPPVPDGGAAAAASANDVVAELFEEFDADGSGFLNQDEVRELAMKLGVQLSDEQAAAAMSEMDPSGDGKADLHEFSGWWRRQAAGDGGGVLGGAVVANAGKALGDLKAFGTSLFSKLETDPAAVERLFAELDADGSGFLNQDEVRELAVKLGASLSEDELAAAMSEMDPSGDGKADLHEFSGWWATQAAGAGGGLLGSAIAANAGEMVGDLKAFGASLFAKPETDPAAVEKLFEEFDADGSGFLNQDEVRELAMKLGVQLSDEQAAAAMSEMDPSGDGKADLHEFSGWWRRETAGDGGGVLGGVVAANAGKALGDLREFGSSLFSKPTQPSSTDVERLFAEMDVDGSGSLQAEEVRALAAKLGAKLSDEQLSAAMLEMDPSGDGGVDVVEFSFWWAEEAKGNGGGVMLGAVAANTEKLMGTFRSLMP
jgi:Ca2+-binding EF-hand superfamily protein